MSDVANHPEINMDPSRFGVFDRTDAGLHTITFTRHLHHPVSKVWRAITVAEHRAQWFPQLSLDPTLGGAAVVDFSGGDCPPPEDNPSDVYRCEVIAIDPPRFLEYKGPGEHHRYELEEENGGCVLTFTALVPDPAEFDDDAQTIQSRFSVSCGWHAMVDQLEWTLDGLPFEDEGYAGPIKTRLYLRYLKMAKNDAG